MSTNLIELYKEAVTKNLLDEYSDLCYSHYSISDLREIIERDALNILQNYS